MDEHTVATGQSWFSRLKNASAGIAVGLLLVIAGAVLLWWNEGRAVLTAKGLAEGAGLVISVPSDRVLPENEGKLVHVSGGALAGGVIADPDFPFVEVRALILLRTAEMFQWKETKHTKETKQLGGSVTTETTYSYSRVWGSSLNDSSRFHEPKGHANPAAMPYSSLTLKAPQAQLGAFSLPEGLLNLPARENLRLPEAPPSTDNFVAARGQIFVGKNPDAPEVGDLRITYHYAPEQEVGVAARQQGNTFVPFSVRDGKRSIYMLQPGLPDASAMFNTAQRENATLAWILRGLGVLGLFAGWYLILRPLGVIGDLVPFIGSILNAGAGLTAFGLSLFCGLIVIALGWIFYRPLMGAALLAGAVAAFAGMRMLTNRRATHEDALSKLHVKLQKIGRQ